MITARLLQKSIILGQHMMHRNKKLTDHTAAISAYSMLEYPTKFMGYSPGWNSPCFRRDVIIEESSSRMTDSENSKLAARTEVTQLVMGLVDSWRLETNEIQAVLAMPDNIRSRKFHKFREGTEAFPEDPAVLRRAGYLLRIADALRTTYPQNPRMAGMWIRQPHRRFGRRTPLSIILADGESGLIAVLSELDCTFSWDLTGSKPS